MPGYFSDVFWTEERRLDWIDSEELGSGERPWIPACSTLLTEPAFLFYSTTGLASGNHVEEATLHGLCELIERDCTARMRDREHRRRNAPAAIDLTTARANALSWLREQIRAAGLQLALFYLPGIVPIPTFRAILFDPESPFACSYINVGYGCHISPTIAAIRAITEAAQSRLTFIHGSREDLSAGAYRFGEAHSHLQKVVSENHGGLPLDAIADASTGDIRKDLALILRELSRIGLRRVFRVDLTHPGLGIPVVKMVVPGLVHPSFPRV
jgi:ribosomal protein S12 methylthiotransferase accessory factor